MTKRMMSAGLAVLLAAVSVVAQPRSGERSRGDGWREKVRAEKVAFFTQELQLTEAEAQAFWPVYNEVEQLRREAFAASGTAFRALYEAVAGGEGDVNALLDAYLDTREKAARLDAEAVTRFKKVLPADKVARAVLAEEKYRHQQIGKGAPSARAEGGNGDRRRDSRRRPMGAQEGPQSKE